MHSIFVPLIQLYLQHHNYHHHFSYLKELLFNLNERIYKEPNKLQITLQIQKNNYYNHILIEAKGKKINPSNHLYSMIFLNIVLTSFFSSSAQRKEFSLKEV